VLYCILNFIGSSENEPFISSGSDNGDDVDGKLTLKGELFIVIILMYKIDFINA
jgi:hypothetical protein